MNAEVARYFANMGCEVVRDRALRCRRWTAIAEVGPDTLVPVLPELDGNEVDAIVQVETNFSMVRLAAAAEL
jgi:maleate isomerase